MNSMTPVENYPSCDYVAIPKIRESQALIKELRMELGLSEESLKRNVMKEFNVASMRDMNAWQWYALSQALQNNVAKRAV